MKKTINIRLEADSDQELEAARFLLDALFDTVSDIAGVALASPYKGHKPGYLSRGTLSLDSDYVARVLREIAKRDQAKPEP